jgi:hypothetical protein
MMVGLHTYSELNQIYIYIFKFTIYIVVILYTFPIFGQDKSGNPGNNLLPKDSTNAISQ